MSHRSREDRGPIALAEKVLALLDEGSFTATYKYAVLLGLIDLCMENTSRTGLEAAEREDKDARPLGTDQQS